VNKFEVTKKSSQLIVLQRIEIANSLLLKLRKIFGRYVFTNFLTKYFISPYDVGKKYYEIMLKEFLTISNEIENPDNKFFLSIGGGIGGLEAVINRRLGSKEFYFIERNFVSKKVVYGWGGFLNSEAYNNVKEQKYFLLRNSLEEKNIHIYDYDNNELPRLKFDIIISLLSLDYHYDFSVYSDYLKSVSTKNTKIIFDTIRPDFFKKIFNNVKILGTQTDTVHKSKRVVCSDFI
jgi:hypothetical protein